MVTTTKKIKITENQLQIVLNEIMKVGKTPYQQFIYYLEEIGKPGRLTGTGNIEEIYRNSMQSALENYIERNTDDPSINYSENDIKELKDEFFNEHSDDFMLRQLEVDKSRNLINVYRALTIPQNNNEYESKKFYKKLQNFLSGTGLSWGMDYESAKAYEGNSFQDEIILCGRVSPDSIDWSYTLSIAADVREDELRLLKNKPVEIYKVVTARGQILPLKTQLIVSTGNSDKWDYK